MLDPTPARKAAARRQRDVRRRKRQGKIFLGIEIDQFELAELLVELRLLGQWDCEDKAKVRAAADAGFRSGALRVTGCTDRDV
jgi:hypothetical protein